MGVPILHFLILRIVYFEVIMDLKHEKRKEKQHTQREFNSDEVEKHLNTLAKLLIINDGISNARL